MGGNSIKDVVKVPAIKIVCIVRNAYLGPSKLQDIWCLII